MRLILRTRYENNCIITGYRLLTNVFDLYGIDNSSFLTANFVINIISIAADYNYSFATELIEKFPIIKLFQNALLCGQFGTGSFSLQLALLQSKYSKLLQVKFKYPLLKTPIDGIRLRFIQNNLLHPTIFNAWL